MPCSTYVVSTVLVFLGGEKRKVFFWEFLLAPKRDTETSRPEPLPVWSSFCHPCFRQFSYWNTFLLMMMGQNWGYESGFDIIISNQPYWNYNGFLTAWRDLTSFSAPAGIEEIAGLLFARGISTQADSIAKICYKVLN